VATARLGARLALDEPPDQVEPPLEGVGILGLAPARCHEDLPDARQAGPRETADRIRVVRHVAPTEQGLALALDDALEDRGLARGRRRILREEDHADRVAFAPAARSRAPCTRGAGTSGICTRMPAPSPDSGSQPHAPRCSEVQQDRAPSRRRRAISAADVRDESDAARTRARTQGRRDPLLGLGVFILSVRSRARPPPPGPSSASIFPETGGSMRVLSFDRPS
jgi:hypothetical protein